MVKKYMFRTAGGQRTEEVNRKLSERSPERFVKNAEGKFRDCTPDEQKQIMTEYCRQFENRKVISYCHYCHEGLLLGGAEAFHLAELLFGG